jgi:hypothetical protein
MGQLRAARGNTIRYQSWRQEGLLNLRITRVLG